MLTRHNENPLGKTFVRRVTLQSCFTEECKATKEPHIHWVPWLGCIEVLRLWDFLGYSKGFYPGRPFVKCRLGHD